MTSQLSKSQTYINMHALRDMQMIEGWQCPATIDMFKRLEHVELDINSPKFSIKKSFKSYSDWRQTNVEVLRDIWNVNNEWPQIDLYDVKLWTTLQKNSLTFSQCDAIVEIWLLAKLITFEKSYLGL